MQRLGNHSRAGGGKGMAVGNRTAKHVEFALIDFADSLRAAKYLTGKSIAGHALQIRQRLRSKGFMHINQG